MASHEIAIKVANTTKFTGQTNEDWDSWIFRFEARFGEEEDSKLAGILRDALDGPALDVCGALGRGACKDYNKLKEALKTKFGKSSDPRRAHADLRRTCQAPGESTEAFAERVRKLATMANPSLSGENLERIALEHFLCGLGDPRLQERLHTRDDVTSLSKAVLVATILQEKEATLAAMRTTQERDMLTAATAHQAGAAPVPHDEEPREEDNLLAVVSELKREFRDLKTQISRKPTAARGGARNRCFECGDVTHFRRNCPRLSSRQDTRLPADNPPRQSGVIQCTGCGRFGHKVAECWRTPAAFGGLRGRRPSTQGTDAFCLGCKQHGHWAADCWQRTVGSTERVMGSQELAQASRPATDNQPSTRSENF